MSANRRIWFFVRKSLLGGLTILLPISIIVFFFRWIYQTVTEMIAPFTSVFINAFGLPKFVADWLAVLAILVLCFLIGTLVATRVGSWIWHQWEEQVMTRLPGYRTVREVIAQLMGNSEDSPFNRGEVARVWLYGRDTPVSVTALITSRHADGHLTVFVPTGPNPTSGFIYHVAEELVERHPEIGVEQMMKTVVACGAGTATLFHKGPPPSA
ncbi:hypothetical protein A11A3_00760 [Alcanivorax hongdengensis A-11-3]|uniref:DUF502 domain-containing protein n=1 Tax=Alcanivorax hongdengensis A-11-3 TaxID=1177179 RepID=L0WJH6_9GAMM|nr:DUF502 domain-containing protein [Alcanivorax hongdengensis]EKF75980.1 hypothetical protein A11A3_00760 [Alcanivorax hongdengensis A-11-3]